MGGILLIASLDLVVHPLLKILILFLSWFCFWYFPHCLAHYLVGRMLGIKFLYYFVGRSSLIKMNLPIITSVLQIFPVLGIKVEKDSMFKVSRKKSAAMYASGVIASMLFPLIPFVYSLKHMDHLITVLVGIMTFGNIVFTIYFSSKMGDFSKALKVLRQK